MSQKHTRKRCPKGTRWNLEQNACIKKTETQEVEPIVYFLISCHGQMECAYSEHYERLKVPENIENIQKMTYAPFGCIRSSIADEEKKWRKSMKKSVFRDTFGPKLEEKMKHLYNETHTSPSSYSPSLVLPNRTLHEEAIKHKDNRYGSFIYKKGETNIDIINKYYFQDVKRKKDNIFIVFQKGGQLKTSEKVFGSEKLQRFMKESKSGPLATILSQQHKFTTELLLEYASFYGYKSVFIFDGSCDVCVNFQGKKYDMKEVTVLADKVKNGLLYRGGS